MNKQEYKHIRNLAWDLLINAKISKLPVDIVAVANVYGFQSVLDNSKSRYENMLNISRCVLDLFGYNSDFDFVKYLTIRVLAPVVVFKALDIKSVDEVCKYTDLPPELASQRFDRYKMLIQRDMFCTSNLEVKVLKQFSAWIESLELH